ncbi:MAG TPA: glycoside hydrolase family 88 protein [Acidobacteriaceae bacterium]
MSGRQKLGVLALAASVSMFASFSRTSEAQQPPATPGLTDTPVAPPNTEALRLAGIARDNSRQFGSDPDDPGPLAKDISPAIKPAAVTAAMRMVADWQLAQSQQYFTVIDRTRLLDGRIWTWSALYAGYMAASSSLGENKYREAMNQIGKSYNWDLRSKLPNADDQSLAQTSLELYLVDKNPEQIAPTKTALDAVLATPRVELGTGKRIEWWWCDALFMAPPVWARMYAATGDTKYIHYLDEEFAKTSQLLYDPVAHLYSRDATFIDKKEKNGQKMFWSRGEGWVMGGLARTLQYLPKDDPARVKYETQLKEMAAAVAKIQRPDGLWTSGLLDPAAYGQPEISGSALMTFGLAWGVNNGILDRKVYTPVITKAWAGMLKHIYADGRLGDIQQTGAQPSTFKPSASYNYGVGGFLLAGSEIHKMADSKHPQK